MRTNEERSALIHRRIRELKRQQARKKERLVDLSCVAGSLILILLLAMWIPDSLAYSEGTMAHSAMTAGISAMAEKESGSDSLRSKSSERKNR